MRSTTARSATGAACLLLAAGSARPAWARATAPDTATHRTPPRAAAPAPVATDRRIPV